MRSRSAVAAALVALGLAGGGYWLGQRSSRAQTEVAQKATYHCPMHPTYVSDKPGNCPICGMRLVPLQGAARPPAAARKLAYYRSPMDPSVRSDKPAKDEMGMDFVPVYEDELQGAGPVVAGRAVLTLSPERRQLLGVRSEAVHVRDLTRTIRTVGRVAVDERRLHHIHTKYEGYVEHLYVDFTGKRVKRGEELLSLYSPDLVATQQEYLLAHRAQRELERTGSGDVAQGGQGLLEAARQRLLFWDIRPADIARLEQTGQVMRTLDLYAESGGYVVQKNVFHGMRVTPADTLFDIADLSQVWVLADVYESDLPAVRPGMTAELRVTYLPGRAWRGPVTYVAPTVEPQTRTVKVRVEVGNADEALKPDMFADVFLETGLGRGLAVPDSAVVQAADRNLVFLDRGEGRLEPREVQLGMKVGDAFHVLSGLKAGDEVVTSANFLLDSESSLRAALALMTPASPAASPSAPAEHRH